MGKRKEYRSKNEKFFIDFLPQEIFDSLKPKEKENYKKYRDNHRYLFQGNKQISDWEKEISQLKEKIRNKKFQINGGIKNERINPIDGILEGDEVVGWKTKMMIGYEGIQHLSKDYQFNISVGFRYRKGKILQNEEKYEGGKTGKKKELRNQTTFKGESLQSHPFLYIRITRTKDVFKNLYVGKEEDVKSLLGSLTKEDWSTVSIEFVKEEIRFLYSSYTRYQVFKSNWKEFFKGKHNFQSVIEWSKKMGDERYKW
jgi:hypothetical protein